MNRLLEKLNNKNTPQKIPIQREKYSTEGNCFFNVPEKVLHDKGKIIYGWKLHDKSKILLEAERHAIWKSPTGELIDVTPDKMYQGHILFIEEDKGWEYEGKFSDNIRVNITDNPLVDDFILLCETIDKLWQTSNRRPSSGKVEIVEFVKNAIDLLEDDKKKRELFILTKHTIESNCYCENGLKYKDCHGLELQKGYHEIMEKVYEVLTRSRKG